tara:strand:- start:230 stop:838 length:609 start_codon:yes stop_codon:yes gene_type:complete
MDWTSILAALITSIATITSVIIGGRYVRRRGHDPVAEDTAQSANVYTALRFILEKLQADRAYVLQFHNGGHYYSGRGQQKFSCTHEFVVEGISHECSFSQEHRVSNYHSYISEMLENDGFCYSDIEDIDDFAFRDLLKHKGVRSIYNVPIKTLNGKTIGILGLDYVKAEGPKKLIGSSGPDSEIDSINVLKSQAQIMAGYLV